MRFFGGQNNPYRILTAMRPSNRIVGLHHYLMVRWRMENNLDGWQRRFRGKSEPPIKQQGGWWNRLRIDGLRPRRRVIDPAPRYERVTRQCNEIRERRHRQGAWPDSYLWAKRYPKRPKSN